MKTIDLIERLRGEGIRLYLEDGQLRYEAPKGRMSAKRLEELRAHRTELVAYLGRLAAEPTSSRPAIRVVARDGALPVSTAQERLWFLYHLDRKGSTYNIPKAIRLKGRLETDALEQSINAIVARHEPLRTSFETVRGEPRQVVHPAVAVPLPIDDLSDLPATDRLAEARRLASEEAHRAFDLASPPLIRTRLIRLNPEDHVFHVTMHHVAADGRSVEIFHEELAELYAASTSGRAPNLTALPIQYADFAGFQREWLGSPEVARQLEYWKSKLAGATPLLELPTDRPRPPLQTFKGAMEYFTIEKELLDRLRALAADRNATLFMVFAAAFATLLSRYSGQEEIMVGCPVENRLFPETERLIGVFINSLVLRLDLGGDPAFSALIDRTREVALDAYANQTIPFEKLVEALQPERNLSASPLFQVAVSWLDGRKGFLSLPGLAAAPFEYDYTNVKFDLNLEVYERDDELGVAWFYNSALFETATVKRFIGAFQTLLADAAGTPARPASRLVMLSEAERRFVIEETNRSETAYPREKAVCRLFEERAAEDPGAVAAACRGERITRGELNARANRFARRLAVDGIGRGDVVAVMMDRSIELLVALLGIQKSGAAYLPIEPGLPAGRFAFMLEDSRARAIVLDGPPPSLPEGIKTFRVDDPSLASLDGNNLDLAIRPEDAVYVMYTSGSTGKPKGVVIEHGGLTNYIWWAAKVYDRGEKLDFAFFTSITFDLTVTSIFMPLIAGGRVEIYGEDPADPRPAIFRVVAENAVEIVKLTPAHLSLVRDLEFEGSRIRRMILGGEDLKTELCRRVTDAFRGGIEILNEYGPTETVVGCMIHRFDPAADTGVSVPIGVPSDNARIYLLDRNGLPAPLGAVGEIHVGGDGVGREYLNRPDLTAERFLADPFRQGARIYRTGDLARRRADGVIEYLGRADDQVKIRGVRIELDEVAAALAEHPRVKDAVAVAIPRSQVVVEAGETRSCVRCGLGTDYPGLRIDAEGVCDMCRMYDRHRHKVQSYFKTPADLEAIIAEAKSRSRGPYDAIVMLSGGKDSSYMLARLVEMGVRPLAYTLDSGYLSAETKRNIRNVTERLGVECLIDSTPHMPTIFVDSLKRHSNVCNGCFKTLYTLSMKLAFERGIPLIITGLSRGQFFETRLSKFYNVDDFDADRLDRAILDARKLYHRMDDVIARTLDTRLFHEDRIFEEVQIVDFYRYVDVGMDELYSYLKNRIGWVRPSDTGRSTNCQINDLGIYVHCRERGYHNYALPYSWDVRMGQKQRDAALEELDDHFDMDALNRMMAEIGYAGPTTDRKREELALAAYYVPGEPVDAGEVRSWLSERLPQAMIPSFLVEMESLPLAASGKVDRKALPAPRQERAEAADFTAPRTPVERHIARIWSDVLGFDRIGIEDNFFTLGGHSLMATRVASRIAEELGADLPLGVIFDRPTIASLAELVAVSSRRADSFEDILAEVEGMSDDEARALLVTAGEANPA